MDTPLWEIWPPPPPKVPAPWFIKPLVWIGRHRKFCATVAFIYFNCGMFALNHVLSNWLPIWTWAPVTTFCNFLLAVIITQWMNKIDALPDIWE